LSFCLLPFGAGDLSALVGFTVDVNDPSGATVLTGTICEPQDHPGGNDGPGGADKPKPRCHTAQLTGDQEVPPVVTTATGTGTFVFTGPDGLTLRYEITVEGLSGPPTVAHIHEGAVGVDGPPIITLDAETLSGAIDVTPEQAAVITSGNAYANVHTAANPDGEIRGQLTPCPDDDEDDGDDEEEEEEEEEEDGEGGGGDVEPLFVMVGEFDALFLRGDANADGAVNISDPLSIFGHLFSGGARPYCLDAADANDNGSVDISDGIALLSYLFQGSTTPASPGTLIPGSDETPDALYCLEQSA
jgi:CHRD domain-containing protein